MHSAGMELLLDLHGCRADALDNPDALDKIMTDVARGAGFDVVSRVAHKFSHQGVTLVLILSQSHIALHTWPEDHFAALDVYVCGEREKIRAALDLVRSNVVERFRAVSSTHQLIERGGATNAPATMPLDTKVKRG